MISSKLDRDKGAFIRQNTVIKDFIYDKTSSLRDYYLGVKYYENGSKVLFSILLLPCCMYHGIKVRKYSCDGQLEYFTSCDHV